jgi:ABC-type Fe3+ transport system permease subunit
MMVWSINLFVLAIGLFIVGMIKPQWILFWMEKPSRMPIVILSVILFMCGAVMFGEANLEKQKEKSEETQQIDQKKEGESEVPELKP